MGRCGKKFNPRSESVFLQRLPATVISLERSLQPRSESGFNQFTESCRLLKLECHFEPQLEQPAFWIAHCGKRYAQLANHPASEVLKYAIAAYDSSVCNAWRQCPADWAEYAGW